ncbi:MAG: hypothetical protein GXP10_00330 [Gammaproteobacteria bacterium]|nr:hypothetical protein [Gammaproteobacteria bacterium]
MIFVNDTWIKALLLSLCALVSSPVWAQSPSEAVSPCGSTLNCTKESSAHNRSLDTTVAPSGARQSSLRTGYRDTPYRVYPHGEEHVQYSDFSDLTFDFVRSDTLIFGVTFTTSVISRLPEPLFALGLNHRW